MFNLPPETQTNIEEALGILWHRFEEGVHKKSELARLIAEGVAGGVLEQLLDKKLVTESNDTLVFSREGEIYARDVTRRHRLAERLLSDVLSLGHGVIDQNACKLEHIISEEVADSICTLLGHPKQCPHGMPVPEGECCRKAGQLIGPIVVPLSQMAAGSSGYVAYVVSKDHPEIHKLLSFGLIPGVKIHVHQTWPTFVVQVGETQLAFEKAIAEHINVRK